MNELSEDDRGHQIMPGEDHFFNQAHVVHERPSGDDHRGGKPAPGKKSGQEEKSVIFHLKTHEDFERHEEDQGGQERIEERP